MRKALFVLFTIFLSVTTNAQNRKWFEGRLYHTDGEVFYGLISWTPPLKGVLEDGDQIIYKREDMAESVPVPSYKVTSFVMGADSFVVSQNVNLKNSPVLHVLLDNPTKLYSVMVTRRGFPLMLNTGGGGVNFGVGMGVATTVGGGVKTTYYYGTSPNKVTKLEKKQFMEVMSNIMADKPEVTAKIKDKIFGYSNIIDLLKYYKNGQMPQSKAYDY